MTKLVVPVLNVLGICFLSRIDSARASTDMYDAMYRKTRDKDETVRSEVGIMSGIFRGEASAVGSEGHEISYNNGIGARAEDSEASDLLTWTEESPGLSEHGSCADDTEYLLAAYEDIRLELSAIDEQYLENASIEDVCVRDGKSSNCNFDFRKYPSNLETICNNRGGSFYLTEHSIQCHNPSTMERLYYQFDHYPSCCSELCERSDANGLLTERIDSITEVMSEYLQMSCFADYDILRHANDSSSLLESSGSFRRSQHWLEIASAVSLLLILTRWN